MKNINFFSNQLKSITWVLIILAGYFILAIPYSCKEEAVSTDDRTALVSRGDRSEDHLELLGISCLPDTVPERCDSVVTIDTMLITLTDYSGCSFWVAYELYNCPYGHYQYYNIGNYYIVHHNCSSFTTAFNSAYAAGGATLAAFVENFDHDIFLKIKTNLANILVPVGSYPCTNSYVTISSYMRVSCYKWCYIEHGQTTIGVKVPCGSDCCGEATSACRDENGNLVLNTSYVYSNPMYCAGPIIYSGGIPPERCTSESECEFNCPD